MFGLISKKKAEALLEEKLAEKDKLLAEKEDELQTTKQRIVTANNTIEEQNKTISGLEEQLESTEKKINESNINRQKEKSALEEKCSSIQKKSDALLAEKDKLLTEKQNELQTVKQSVVTANNKIEEQNKTISGLEEKLKCTEKKLKNAEDDLDDLQEDYDDEVKNSKKLKESNINLQTEKSELEEKYSSIQKKVDTAEKELHEKNDKLELKKKSIEFVQELLKAKEVTASNENDYYSKIESVVNYIQNDFKECVAECKDLLGWDYEKTAKLFNEELNYWVASQRKVWLKNKRTIAFVGGFSAGKTSIVNKILSSGKTSIALPVGTKATTAIPTYISNSFTKIPTYHFFTPDNKLKILNEETFKKVDKNILSEIDGISNLIKYFVMSCDNNNLENLSILDTPGFISNDKEDAERTIEVINECDALFWVIDVNDGTIKQSSLKTIKEYLRKPLYVVINKVDTKSQNETNNVECSIKKIFEKEKVDVQKYIRFSKKETPAVILNELKSISNGGNESDYLKELEDTIHSLQKKLEEQYTKISSERADFETQAKNEKDTIDSLINKFKEKCEDVNQTITESFKKHRFTKKEQYEISIEDYNLISSNFSSLIGDNTTKSVVKLLSESVENYGIINKAGQKANNDYEDIKAKKKSFDNCVKQLKMKLNKIGVKI